MSIRIDGTNTTANPGITGSDTDTGLQFGTNEVKIVTDGSDRVTVDSSGNVAINTSTPFSDAELTVGNGGSGDATIALRRTASGQNDWAITNSGGNLIFKGSDATTVAGLTEYFRFRDTGGLTFNGDSAAANALNDYEEGTFTPVWQTTGTAFSSVTYTHQDGKYTKIGNIVHVSLKVRSSASSGGSGNLLVGGLPFTINDSAGSGGGSPATYYIDYHNSTINVATETKNNSSQFYLLSSLDNASWSNVSAGGIQGSGVSEIRVSFDYFTDS